MKLKKEKLLPYLSLSHLNPSHLSPNLRTQLMGVCAFACVEFCSFPFFLWFQLPILFLCMEVIRKDMDVRGLNKTSK